MIRFLWLMLYRMHQVKFYNTMFGQPIIRIVYLLVCCVFYAFIANAKPHENFSPQYSILLKFHFDVMG